MVAVFDLDNSRDVEKEWEAWHAECQASWETMAEELEAQGYVRIPDKYFGSVFEKDGVRYYLSRVLGNTVWIAKQLPLRDDVDRGSEG